MMWYLVKSITNCYKQLVSSFMTMDCDIVEECPKVTAKNLLNFNDKEKKEFLSSFDNVICDCDGVLWNNSVFIDGVQKSLDLLKSEGKSVHFLTNNSLKSLDNYKSLFKKIGIAINSENFSYSTSTVINYLKSIGFNKTLFVIGSSSLVNELNAAGISCVTAKNEIKEDIHWFVNYMKEDNDIGGVYLDSDMNLNYLKISKAVSLLRNPKVLYLIGALDGKITVTEDLSVIGLRDFAKIVSEYSNRKPSIMGKPGSVAKDVIMKQFNIQNPARTLFIGDSMDSDMAFADLCGFQKLLVFSGVSTPEDVVNNTDASLNPHYTLSSLSQLSYIFV